MLPLYLARIEDLGRGDLLRVDCAACDHVALLTPEFLLRLGSALGPRCLISSGASGAADAERGDEPWFRSSGSERRRSDLLSAAISNSNAGAAKIEPPVAKRTAALLISSTSDRRQVTRVAVKDSVRLHDTLLPNRSTLSSN
jgi:hypothetical protein